MIDCGSQITICDLPIRFDTYKGCTHACKYCFVQRKTDISEVEINSGLGELKNFIEGKRTQTTNWCDWQIPLHWGGCSDPFQPIEKRYRISYKALEIFKETQYPFIVSTKGKLIAEPEYLDLLKQCNAVVQISLVCDKYDKIEQGAPTYKERIEIIHKVAPNVKRLIVRIQPYLHEVYNDVMRNLEDFKNAGAYGITIEGMKFVRKQNGLVKIGGDYCYPVNVLQNDFENIKRKCRDIGLRFYCAENRLRGMGDSLTCCGIDGLEGFSPNECNLSHLKNGHMCDFTDCMKAKGTAKTFNSIYQEAGSSKWLSDKSFMDMMCSDVVANSSKDIFSK